ncbi:MAG: glycosyltransferase family 2 protein [Anaerolineales bacterium]|nr:MAG: glycosyltransferase family 2 protein [Anaerolineales bacterium]
MGVKISAIIPTYNRSPFSPKDRRNPLYISIHALYEQTLSPEEVVIVDDCSEDNTSRVVENLQKKCPIKYLRLEERTGPSLARRRGVEHADNPFLLFLDDDSFPLTKHALEYLYSGLEKYDLDAVVPPIFFRSTEFEGVVPTEKIGKLDEYHVYSNFDKTPRPYSEMIEVSNLPGIFLAKKEILKPDYFVKLPWPSNWGIESFLAWNLIQDRRKLGYLAKKDAAFIHLKFGWHMDGSQPFDEKIATLPEDLNFRDLLIISNKQIHNTRSRDSLTIEDWYRYRIAFSTFLYLCNGNSVDNFAKTIEPFIRSEEFCSFGHPRDDKISEIIDEGIEIGERGYERFFRPP